MYDAYVASCDLLVQLRSSLGPRHVQLEPTKRSELAHLKKIFNSIFATREDVLALAKHIGDDTRACFSEAQGLELVESASARLSLVTHLEGSLPTGQEQGGGKCQTHLTSFNYYNIGNWEDWARYTLDLLWKFTLMSKIWLGWGFIHPTAPSFRIGLATIIVASGYKATPDEAHQLLADFVDEFRRIRSVAADLTVTCKTFPTNVKTFAMLHGDRLGGDPVACQVCPQTIKEWALPSRIPIRSSARSIRSKTPPEQVVPAKSGGQTEVMTELFRNLIDRKCSPSPSPSPSDQPDGETRRSGSPGSHVSTPGSRPERRRSRSRLSPRSRHNAGRRRGVASPGSVQTCVVTLPTKIATLAERSPASFVHLLPLEPMATIVPPITLGVATKLTPLTRR